MAVPCKGTATSSASDIKRPKEETNSSTTVRTNVGPDLVSRNVHYWLGYKPLDEEGKEIQARTG